MALISVLVLGDSLSWLAWSGIAVICLSILAMAMNGRMTSRKGVWLALLNACFIAGYTLVDGTGVRLSDTALGLYAVDLLYEWLLPALLGDEARRREASRYLRTHWKKGLRGGSAPWALTACGSGR